MDFEYSAEDEAFRAELVAVGATIRTRMSGAAKAVFLAVGAHIAKRAYLPAGSAGKMLDAVSVLRSMEGEDQPLLGRRVELAECFARRDTSGSSSSVEAKRAAASRATPATPTSALSRITKVPLASANFWTRSAERFERSKSFL